MTDSVVFTVCDPVEAVFLSKWLMAFGDKTVETAITPQKITTQVTGRIHFRKWSTMGHNLSFMF
ncbi:MAG TPA: hypothetical protein VHO71_03050 [Caproiciproducens sp.]|nr:hypothetical protein [Caproiciproducens sp.]